MIGEKPYGKGYFVQKFIIKAIILLEKQRWMQYCSIGKSVIPTFQNQYHNPLINMITSN